MYCIEDIHITILNETNNMSDTPSLICRSGISNELWDSIEVRGFSYLSMREFDLTFSKDETIITYIYISKLEVLTDDSILFCGDSGGPYFCMRKMHLKGSL